DVEEEIAGRWLRKGSKPKVGLGRQELEAGSLKAARAFLQVGLVSQTSHRGRGDAVHGGKWLAELRETRERVDAGGLEAPHMVAPHARDLAQMVGIHAQRSTV